MSIERAKTSPGRQKRGEGKPMTIGRGERQAHGDRDGEGARVNRRRTAHVDGEGRKSPRRWKRGKDKPTATEMTKEPASADGGRALVD